MHRHRTKQQKSNKPRSRPKNSFEHRTILVLTGLSILFLLRFTYGCLTKMWIIEKGTSTLGIVTEFETLPANFKGFTSYAIDVAYNDASGHPKKYETSSSHRPDLGEKVPLWYLQDRVLLKSISAWTDEVISGVFGLFFALARYLVKRSEFNR